MKQIKKMGGLKGLASMFGGGGMGGGMPGLGGGMPGLGGPGMGGGMGGGKGPSVDPDTLPPELRDMLNKK